eukprot:351970-Chlamydomonas_euryale.AAC.3
MGACAHGLASSCVQVCMHDSWRLGRMHGSQESCGMSRHARIAVQTLHIRHLKAGACARQAAKSCQHAAHGQSAHSRLRCVDAGTSTLCTARQTRDGSGAWPACMLWHVSLTSPLLPAG